MGNSESHDPADDPHHDDRDRDDEAPEGGDGVPAHQGDDDPFDGIETLGYRVLGVQPGSPAAAAGLVSFLDFLVGVGGRMLLGSGADLEPGDEYDDVDLPAVLEENRGRELEFLVWNMKSQSARLVHLTPRDDWGGAGLLGVTIRLDDYAGAEDRLVRVLEVEPGSPADQCGLQPLTDFLLGTTHQTLDSVDRLAHAVLRPNVNRVVELYVYNTGTDLVRVVALMPTYHWGGDGSRPRGLLGAEVGTGYLHRLPHTTRATAGSSVERKVRYVSVEEPAAPPQEPVAPESDEDRMKTPQKQPQQQQQQQQQKLELEPQLEMEPGSEDEDDEVESVTLTENSKNQKASPDNRKPAPVDSKPAAATNGGTSDQHQQQHTKSTNHNHASKAPPRAPSSYGLQPEEVQAFFQKPPPTSDSAASTPAAVPVQHTYSNASTGSTGTPYYTPQQHQQQHPSPQYGGSPSHHPQQQQRQHPQPFASAPPPPNFAGPQRSSSYTYQQPGPPPVPTYQQKSSPAAHKPAPASGNSNPFSAAAAAPMSGDQTPFAAAAAAPSGATANHTNNTHNNNNNNNNTSATSFAIAPPPQMSYYGGGAAQQQQPSSAPFASSYGGASYGGGAQYSGAAAATSYGMAPPPIREGGAAGVNNQQQQQQSQSYAAASTYGAAPYSAS